jgi:hypothetical protein
MCQLFDHPSLGPFAHTVYNDPVSDWYHITTLNREIGFILDTEFFFINWRSEQEQKSAFRNLGGYRLTTAALKDSDHRWASPSD